MEKQTELDVGSDKRQDHQPRPRTLVCHTSQQSQGRSLRRQPLGLRLQAERGRGCDRRSRIARPVEKLAMAGISRRFTLPPTAAIYMHRNLPSPGKEIEVDMS